MKNWRIKDGVYVHDGDCEIYRCKICTCGLLHYLSQIFSSTDNTDEFPTFDSEWEAHDSLCEYLSRNPPVL